MVQNRATEEHMLYLFDLAHGNLNDEDIVRGFIKYYVLNGFTLGNLQDDYVFRTHYPIEGVQAGLQRLRAALEQMAEDAKIRISNYLGIRADPDRKALKSIRAVLSKEKSM